MPASKKTTNENVPSGQNDLASKKTAKNYVARGLHAWKYKTKNKYIKQQLIKSL